MELKNLNELYEAIKSQTKILKETNQHLRHENEILKAKIEVYKEAIQSMRVFVSTTRESQYGEDCD